MENKKKKIPLIHCVNYGEPTSSVSCAVDAPTSKVYNGEGEDSERGSKGDQRNRAAPA